MNPLIHVWITRDSLTDGIIECDVRHCIDVNPNKVRYKSGIFNICYYGEGREWHRTRASAIRRARKMRVNRLRALKQELNKLQKMKF